MWPMWKESTEKFIFSNLFDIPTSFNFIKSWSHPSISSLLWNTWKMASFLTTSSRKNKWIKIKPAKSSNKLSVEFNTSIS